VTLRDRKKERTRQALVDAATELFSTRGYDATTIADLAAAADIGTRTFFSYFASKEDLLFPESDIRVRAAIDAIDARGPDDGPADLLMRGLRNAGDDSGEMLSRLAALRVRLARTVPAVRGKALQVQSDAMREIARHLQAAFPDELDEVTAAAMVGAFIGAVGAALQVLLERAESEDPAQPRSARSRAESEDPAQLREQVRRATDVALAPWRR
jgi:AcrR family transcriptional regulator